MKNEITLMDYTDEIREKISIAVLEDFSNYTPTELLALASEEDVQAAFAANSNTPKEVIEHIKTSNSDFVQYVLQHSSCAA